MSRPRKAHVIEERYQSGGFHIERHIRCRCGAIFTHYNAGHALAMFKEHQRLAEIPGDPPDAA